MDFLIYPSIIYVTTGLAIAGLCWLGVARTQIIIHILHREVEPAYAHAALLVMAVFFWPIVIWMILVGRRREREAAQAEMDAKADAHRTARFAQMANAQGVAQAIGLADRG